MMDNVQKTSIHKGIAIDGIIGKKINVKFIVTMTTKNGTANINIDPICFSKPNFSLPKALNLSSLKCHFFIVHNNFHMRESLQIFPYPHEIFHSKIRMIIILFKTFLLFKWDIFLPRKDLPIIGSFDSPTSGAIRRESKIIAQSNRRCWSPKRNIY